MALFTDFFIALFGTGYYATKYAVSKGKGYAYDEEIQKEIREKRRLEEAMNWNKRAIQNIVAPSDDPIQSYLYKVENDTSHKYFPVVTIIESPVKKVQDKRYTIWAATGFDFGNGLKEVYLLDTYINDFSVSREDFFDKIVLSLKEKSKITNIDFISSDIVFDSKVLKDTFPKAKLFLNIDSLLFSIYNCKAADNMYQWKIFYKKMYNVFMSDTSQECEDRFNKLAESFQNDIHIANRFAAVRDNVKAITKLPCQTRDTLLRSQRLPLRLHISKAFEYDFIDNPEYMENCVRGIADCRKAEVYITNLGWGISEDWCPSWPPLSRSIETAYSKASPAFNNNDAIREFVTIEKDPIELNIKFE